MTGKPPAVAIPREWTNPRQVEEFFHHWATDNISVVAAEQALLTIQANVDGLSSHPGSPTYQELCKRDVGRLRGIRNNLAATVKVSRGRMEDVEEVVENLGHLWKEYEKLRGEHDRMIERTHESRETAEYYRQLLEEHHIEY